MPRKGVNVPGAAVGIDLGTTYSAVAVSRKGKVEILANDHCNRTTPSIVGFVAGESYVGEPAKDLPAVNQVFDAKRLIGRQWSDRDFQEDRALWPFEVVEQDGVPKFKVDVGGKKEFFSPEEISGMVLHDLKRTAEAALGEKVSKAVVTVPAYFNERQRQATKVACRIAGLEVLGMISEPTAAAIAHGLDKRTTGGASKTVFIYDLGGGTFDVAAVKICGDELTVLCAGGITHLGGRDFDQLLLKHCLQDVKRRLNVDITEDKQAVEDLRKACELAKRKLSNMLQTTISVVFPGFGKAYKTTITRAFFEDLCDASFRATLEVSRDVLAEAKVARAEVDEVLLVGGSSRIPKVRAMLRDVFGAKKVQRLSVNPDEAVACGAAVHAATLAAKKPCSDQVNKGVKPKDVTALSLGISLRGGRFSCIIKKNTPIPCKKTRTYCTVRDNQSKMSSKIYQGERPLVKDNFYLNKDYKIKVPRKPAREAVIDVTFEIDASGLLTVTAAESTSGQQVKVQVTRQEAHLSEADIQAMTKRARSFRREDEEALREVEERLKSQSLE